MAVINTFSAGMPSNIGTWNLRSDSPAFRITAHQLVGGAVEVYFSTTAGRINWDYWTLMNPSTRFPKWFLDAATFISHPKSECTVTITFPLSTVMVINFGAPGANLPPPIVPTATANALVTASGTPWSTATTMTVEFKKYGNVGWLFIPALNKAGDVNTETISFIFGNNQWPTGFKPLPQQSFPFGGVYPNGLYFNALGGAAPYFASNDLRLVMEVQPANSFNLIRITAVCRFDGKWGGAWEVYWGAQVFTYHIDNSV